MVSHGCAPVRRVMVMSQGGWLNRCRAGRVLDVALLVLGKFSLLKWMDPASSSVHLLYLEATEESRISFWFTETWVLFRCFCLLIDVNCCP